MKKEYSVSDQFIIRYPFFPFTYDSGWDLKDIYESEDFLHPLFIASPVLFDEFKKHKEGKIKDQKSIDKINLSLYKYWSRIKSRSTPFGLFSGVSVGNIEHDNALVFSENSYSKIRMDMKYLYNVFLFLKDLPEVKQKTLFYANDSVYSFYDKYRFIERKYAKDVIKYEISATDRSSVLKKILVLSKNGICYQEILNFLVSEGYEEDEGLYEYIDQIIESQVLVNELEPTLIGEDYLEKIITTLEKRGVDHAIVNQLKELKSELDTLNHREATIKTDDILQIEKIVKNIEIPFESQYLTQIDSSKQFQSSALSKEYTDELSEAVSFLSKIGAIKNENDDLKSFIHDYSEKYETEELPILHALDPEIGIGYPVGKNVGNEYSNSLIHNFQTHMKRAGQEQRKWDQIQDVLMEKILKAKESQHHEITLSKEDFPFWDKLEPVNTPPVLHSMFEVINDPSSNTLLHIHFVGAGSGANLMGRFSRLDQKMEAYIQDLIKIEQANSNAELVELSHLSDSPRIGNISIRPKLTQYEITCLSNSNLDQQFVIPLSDIMISVKRDKIVLRSKKLKKEILPVLTTAHNYKNSSLDIYKFLCDLQHQNFLFKGFMVNFNLNLNHLPRIRYKNTVLRLASWQVKKTELSNLLEKEVNDEVKMENIKKWSQKRNIPQYILISEGDNEMFIDFHNSHSVNVFLSLLKKNNTLNLVEFLFNDKTAVVKDHLGNPYRNQIIIPLFKNNEN
ncbi:lantibiotic dehydratase family protein [Chryseobacterium sp. PMSZPI]|uniref:lantibiotic dehydratase family protein n=1 Tax=Chryseobacterium sp. PMSZPI TaxID=1033900 RepID=UPI001610999F|nr:lantibiotic dehydratase family protein [Chryseobacterium sp. PMSZPI]